MNTIFSSKRNAECPDMFENEICRLLGEEAELIRAKKTGSGSFEKTVLTENGDTVTWRFPLASGFRQLSAFRQYCQRFEAEPPDWLDRRPPFHMSRLCELAIIHDRPLPAWGSQFALAFSRPTEHRS